MDTKGILAQIEEIIQKGNVSKVVVKRGDKEVLQFPVTIGAAGVIIGLFAAQWALLAAVIAVIGYDCSVELYMYDGTVKTILASSTSSEIKEKVVDAAQNIKDDLKEVVNDVTKGQTSKKVEAAEKDFDKTVSKDEAGK